MLSCKFLIVRGRQAGQTIQRHQLTFPILDHTEAFKTNTVLHLNKKVAGACRRIRFKQAFHLSSYCSSHTSSSRQSSHPTVALVKEYVPGPSSTHDTFSNDAKSQKAHSSISNYQSTKFESSRTEKDTEKDKKHGNSFFSMPGSESEPNTLDEESQVKIFLGASIEAVDSILSSENAPDVIRSSESALTHMVKLQDGSPEERIVKQHGLAALSYHQALDVVWDANGKTMPQGRIQDADYDTELNDPPASYQSSDSTSTSDGHRNYDSSSDAVKPASYFSQVFTYAWEAVVSCFVPKGYPHSVSSDYAKYYKRLFIQNVAGSFSYVMSMTALLQAVGIGTGALGTAAAISWVMKDGLGAIGMIAAAKFLGDASSFDANTIRSKFRADIAHNLGVALELLTMIFPGSFLLLASGANTLKGVAGLVNGACKASINQRMAVANNLGDITAKGHVQGLAAYLSGLSLGVFYDFLSPYLVEMIGPDANRVFNDMLGLVGVGTLSANTTNSSVAILWALFFVSAFIHLAYSYYALRALALPSLNQSRTHLLASKYLEANPVIETSQGDRFWSDRDDLVPPMFHAFKLPEAHVRPNLPTPFDLSKEAAERIILPPFLDSVPHIILGAGIEQTFGDCPELLQPVVKRSIGFSYMIHGDQKGTQICIVLSSEATSTNLLRAFFHACTIRSIMLSEEVTGVIWSDSKFDMIKRYVDREYPHFETQLEESGWRLDQILLAPKAPRADWTLSSNISPIPPKLALPLPSESSHTDSMPASTDTKTSISL